MIHAAEGRGSIFGRETKIPQAARRDQKTKTKNNSSEKKPKKNKKELRLILAISITKMEITDTKLLCFSFPVFFLSIMTALLRYNSHTIEFTHVTCIIQCFFSIFAELCNHHYNLILEHFPHPQKKPSTCWQSFLILSLLFLIHLRENTHLFSVSWICQFWTFRINGTIQHVVFCDWLLSCSMFSRFIHVVAYISISFLFIAK